MPSTPSTEKPRTGLVFNDAFTGKFLHRVRELHISTYAELLTGRLEGAVKLDLLLRSVAFYPQHMGNRKDDPGLTVPSFSYDDVYDLIGPPDGSPVDSRSDRKRRRNWVGRQLAVLEGLDLVRMAARPGDTPRLWVLRDDRTGAPFDDPGEDAKESGTRFVTLVMTPFATGHARKWGVPELTTYLAAMTAEVYERSTTRDAAGAGGRRWARPPEWFAKPGNIATGPIRFGSTSFYDGVKSLEGQRLVHVDYIRTNPWTNRPWKGGPRNVYTNRFVTETQDLLSTREQLRDIVTADDFSISLDEVRWTKS